MRIPLPTRSWHRRRSSWGRISIARRTAIGTIRRRRRPSCVSQRPLRSVPPTAGRAAASGSGIAAAVAIPIPRRTSIPRRRGMKNRSPASIWRGSNRWHIPRNGSSTFPHDGSHRRNVVGTCRRRRSSIRTSSRSTPNKKSRAARDSRAFL